jgi:hypothetical protein
MDRQTIVGVNPVFVHETLEVFMIVVLHVKIVVAVGTPYGFAVGLDALAVGGI